VLEAGDLLLEDLDTKMDNRSYKIIKIILALMAIILLITPAVLAERFEDNRFKYGTININGNLVTTNTAINNVNVIGFVCNSANCATASEKLWPGVFNSGNNLIQLTYPTTLKNSNGYGIYMYKNGYIPYEVHADWWGTNPNDPVGPFDNYLTKKQLCVSNVNSMSASKAGNNINVDVNVRAPISHDGLLDYVPSEILNHYTTEVDVNLEVKRNSVIVYTETKKVNIEYSHNKNVDFSFPVSTLGKYDVRVYTTLNNEEKCLDYVEDEKTASITFDQGCFQDNDCQEDYYGGLYCIGKDVYKDFHDFSCIGGSCNEDITEILIKECATACENGACVDEPIECEKNSDCDDLDLYTIDECINPGTPQSYCQNTPINCINNNDCGMTGFFGDEYCMDEDVYKDFQDSICKNPGTKQSYCDVSITPTFLIDCGEDICNDFGDDYCFEGDVYHSRACFDNTCNSGACYSIPFIDKELVEECNLGCFDGECLPECTEDEDCGEDYYGDNYCIDDDAYKDFHDFSCENENCEEDITPEFVANCEFGCDNGQCLQECSLDSDCGDDYYGDNYCIDDDVYKDLHDFSCIGGSCVEDIFPELVEKCAGLCVDGECKDIECNTNADCDDSDDYTYDECNNPGTPQSYCTNTPINCIQDSDCGNTGFIDDPFCFENDVFKNFQTANCIDPGLKTSYCKTTNETLLFLDCGEDYCGDYGENYCEDGDVYKSRTCFDQGCLFGECFSDQKVEEVLVQDCEFGCDNGECITQECCTDEDCPTDFFGSNYCENDDVYRDLHDFSCVNGLCVENIIPELVEECVDGCINGECVEECCTDEDCPDDYYGDKFCKYGDVYKELHDFSCVNGECIEEIILEIVEECDSGEVCRNGECEEREERERDKGCIDHDGDGYCDTDIGPMGFDSEIQSKTQSFSMENIPSNVTFIDEPVQVLGTQSEVIVSKQTSKYPIFIWMLIVLILVLLVLIVIFAIVRGISA